MKIREIMTEDPVCCTPETKLQRVAQLMIENDCGCIPVIESRQNPQLLGLITDRDIVCRTIAQGQNPLELTAKDCMSSPCVTVAPTMSLEECCEVLKNSKVRRVPVVDQSGWCCGIVSQADIARRASDHQIAWLLKEISEEAESTSEMASIR